MCNSWQQFNFCFWGCSACLEAYPMQTWISCLTKSCYQLPFSDKIERIRIWMVLKTVRGISGLFGVQELFNTKLVYRFLPIRRSIQFANSIWTQTVDSAPPPFHDSAGGNNMIASFLAGPSLSVLSRNFPWGVSIDSGDVCFILDGLLGLFGSEAPS